MYHMVARFAHRWRVSRARKIEHDLCFNPIEHGTPQHARTVVEIFQDKTLYIFRIAELINVVDTSLSHATAHFFVDPLPPKNPFTNREFSQGALLHIYLAVRHSTYRAPILFELFFRNNFDVKKLMYNHEAILRERFLERFVTYSDTGTLVIEIRKMIIDLGFRRIITIHHEFPANKIVAIFRPFLQLYVLHRYSMMSTTKHELAFSRLQKALRRFVAYNPDFGRKTLIRTHVFQSNCQYNEKYIVDGPLSDKYVRAFSCDHLPFSECVAMEQSPSSSTSSELNMMLAAFQNLGRDASLSDENSVDEDREDEDREDEEVNDERHSQQVS
jgi:hypothetical protein